MSRSEKGKQSKNVRPEASCALARPCWTAYRAPSAPLRTLLTPPHTGVALNEGGEALNDALLDACQTPLVFHSTFRREASRL